MSADDTAPTQTHPVTRPTESDRVLAVVNYVLFLVGPANGVTMVIAGVLALIRREQSQGWITSHFTYQIYTVLYGLGFFLAGVLTIWLLGLGLLVWLLGAIWVVLRAVVGLFRVIDARPHPNPRGLMF